MSVTRTKVLVIGGGPAGSLAARYLAREGVDTLLIERNFSFVKPCGGGVQFPAFTELQLPSRLVKKSVNTIRLVAPSGDSVLLRLKEAAIAIVSRGEFDSALREEARRAGARVLEAEFRRFINIGTTITSEVASDGETVCVEADYVVAADGVNSRVRAALNMKPVASALTVSQKVKGEETDTCEFWFGASHAPRLYSWVFPQEDGVSVGTGSLNPREIKALWRKFLERRSLEKDPEPPMRNASFLRGYRVPLWKGDLYSKGRILFTGDSAGQVLPLTYEGIYYAMKSGELAAEAILGGNEGDYKRLWKRDFRKRFFLIKRLWEYFLKNDARTERLIRLQKRPEVQEASMKLLLGMQPGKESLSPYLTIFRRLFS